jgi:hypothetical protein
MSSSNDQVATADGDGAASAENQVGQGDEVRTFLSINCMRHFCSFEANGQIICMPSLY